MLNLINYRIRLFGYWIRLFGYYLRYNKIVHRFQVELEFWHIDRRLKVKNYSLDKIIKIMQRYANIRQLKIQLGTRKSIIELNQSIAQISDKTGVPQWQLRDKIKSDFNIDI